MPEALMGLKGWVTVGRVALAVAVAGSVGIASADDPLASLLVCQRAPHFTQLLLGFKQAGLLGAAVETASHNQTCWSFEPALKYRGMQFVSVCVALDRLDEARHHPELYSGLSLAPYAGFWLEAQVSASTLWQWATMVLPVRGHFEIHATDGGAVVACTGSWFPPASAKARA